MDHRPLHKTQLAELAKALRGNADSGLALLTGRDTSFAGTSVDLPDPDAEMIDAIRSVPCHY